MHEFDVHVVSRESDGGHKSDLFLFLGGTEHGQRSDQEKY